LIKFLRDGVACVGENRKKEKNYRENSRVEQRRKKKGGLGGRQSRASALNQKTMEGKIRSRQ